jgi:hypothetical protein
MDISSFNNPFLLQRFFLESQAPISRQTWDNGTNEIIDSSIFHKLRLFPPLKKENGKTVFLFPPHAGRHPNVTNNLIRACQETGFQVVAFELLPAKYGDSLDFDGLVKLATSCLKKFQDYISVGVCQGSWLNSLAIDQSPNKPVAQFVFAGPVDFWAGDGYIKKACQLPFVFDWIKFVVVINQGIQPAWVQWWNFTMANPKAVFWDDYVKLWHLIVEGKGDGKILQWKNNHDWYWSPQNLHKWFLSAVKDLFIDNKLKDMVDFSKFNWPLYLYVGNEDEITLPVQTIAMKGMVAPDVTTIRAFDKCGHTAVFCKKEPLQQFQADLMRL